MTSYIAVTLRQWAWAVAHKTFTIEDQIWFAELSGDWNPMHVDVLAARRTPPGAPVVHGVHAALWALEQLPSLENVSSVKVQFSKFVYLNRPVTMEIVRRDETMLRASLNVEGMTVIALTLRFGPRKPGDFPTLPPAPSDLAAPSFEEMANLEGWLQAKPTVEFPKLTQALGARRVEALIQLSTLVGMVCPGLHSVFAGFSVDLVDDDRRGLGWKTIRTDDRFSLLTIGVGGSIQGDVTAFARPAPVDTPDMADIRARVRSGEFAGRNALIVGGSRGLGAVTAKLLVAGGADVTITYASGKTEAEALAAEIGCGVVLCDVTDAIDLGAIPPITHLYYFATPQIYRQTAEVYASERFAEFVDFYVEGLLRVLRWLQGNQTSLKEVLCPSSVFVEEHPAGLTEYAMAKAASEVLCAALSRPGLRISAPRLPRVLTDQTATVPPVAAEASVDVMLPFLRN